MRVDGLVGGGGGRKWGVEVGFEAMEEKEATSHWGRYMNMYPCDSTIAGHKAGLRREEKRCCDACMHGRGSNYWD